MYQEEIGVEKVSPRYWRPRGQRVLIDSVAALVVLGSALLIIWPGDSDAQAGRLVGGMVALFAASMLWVRLRLYNDRLSFTVGLIGTWFGLALFLGMGSQAVQRIVVNETGKVHQVQVVHVAEDHVKSSTDLTYSMTHIDGSPVCGKLTVVNEPRFAAGQWISILEDPDCTFSPILPGQANYGFSIGVAVAGFVVFGIAGPITWLGYRSQCKHGRAFASG